MKRSGTNATFARQLGRLVKGARLGKERSVVWVARRAGIHPDTLKKLEVGYFVPKADTLARIWLALGFSLDDLMLEAASESGMHATAASDEPGQDR